MKLLALDQSTVSTGYTVFNNEKIEKYGLIKEKANKKISPTDKMANMFIKITELINKENPDMIAIEQVQFQNMVRVFRTLTQLQGMIMGYLVLKDIPFVAVEPSSWRKHCGIKGRKRAEQKENTQIYIKKRLNIDVSEDEADSLCIGIWAIENLKENVDGKEN